MVENLKGIDIKKSKHLLIIGGTGRNSGKSTLAEMLVSKFRKRGVYCIKITPHTHPDISGLMLLTGNERFQVYEESADNTGKDTARMLKAGAIRVFLIVSCEKEHGNAFSAVQPFIPAGSPVICESPALRRFIEPGLFIIMKHDENFQSRQKNIDSLLPLADRIFLLEDIKNGMADIIDLESYNHWYLKQ